jgi:hypothetical protein
MSDPDLIDVSRDPIVMVAALPAGAVDRVSRYHAALEWLIARGTPFVMVTRADDTEGQESHEDQKARTIWFKAHVADLVRVCRGFVYIEPDAQKRLFWETRAKAMAAVFPVPMAIAVDEPQAFALANEFIAI